jgi:SAM-dependent methyltransferase
MPTRPSIRQPWFRWIRLLSALWPSDRGGRHHRLFSFMYRAGLTPWDGHPQPARLKAAAAAPTKGRALDVGCGTGDTAVFLAGQGWEVTAVDFVQRALDVAGRKAADAGVSVRFVRADVTRLSSADIGGGFRLIVDNGCMHGMGSRERDAYVREIDALAAAGATMVLTAFPPAKRRGPAGIGKEEIEERFGRAWELVGSGMEEGISSDPSDPIHVYELRRREGE